MNGPDEPIDRQTEIRHLLRRVKTALELAIVARAPAELLNRLGRVAGLLDATVELSIDAPPVDALVPDLIAEGYAAVARWEAWQSERAATA